MRPSMLRRRAVFGLASLLLSLGASAQPWPARPVKVVVPFAAGSAVDVIARTVFEQLATRLGQAIVVENRVGAGGTIAAGSVARAEPDGYTVLATTSAHTIAPALYPALPYDLQRDFVAVAAMGITPFVLVVSPTRGFTTVRDLVEAAKAAPGSFNFASVGEGSASHLSAERFRLSAGVDAQHVPFKGGPEAMTEVIAGRIDFFFVALGAALPQIRSGRLAALAVNGSARSSTLPGTPTTAEAGVPGAEYPTWFGVFVPAGTPRGIVDKLGHATAIALREPGVRDRLAGLGVEPMTMTTDEFDAHVRKEATINRALVDAIGLKAK